MSVALLLSNNWKKRSPTFRAQLHLPAHDLFWANRLRVQHHLPAHDLFWANRLRVQHHLPARDLFWANRLRVQHHLPARDLFWANRLRVQHHLPARDLFWANRLRVQLHLPARDLFWANRLRVQHHLPPLDLAWTRKSVSVTSSWESSSPPCSWSRLDSFITTSYCSFITASSVSGGRLSGQKWHPAPAPPPLFLLTFLFLFSMFIISQFHINSTLLIELILPSPPPPSSFFSLLPCSISQCRICEVLCSHIDWHDEKNTAYRGRPGNYSAMEQLGINYYAYHKQKTELINTERDNIVQTGCREILTAIKTEQQVTGVAASVVVSLCLSQSHCHPRQSGCFTVSVCLPLCLSLCPSLCLSVCLSPYLTADRWPVAFSHRA